MMTTTEHLLDQLHKIYYGPCWVGTNMKLALENVDAAMAIRKLSGDHLSICQLVQHTRVWNDVVVRRLTGEAYIPDPAIDFPLITDTSEEAWDSAKASLFDSVSLLTEAIRSVDGSRLDEPIIPEYTTCFNHINGTILHAMYHAGQIGLLKKIFSNTVQ